MSGFDDARRTSFGGVASEYDRHRPSYPAALVDDVLDFAGARSGTPALDVGAGTGKATALFAARGLDVTAIEPSAEMADVARANSAITGVPFIVDTFEAIPLAPHHYGLVFSGQAWHWLAPIAAERIAAATLVSGGALACFWNRVDWSHCELQEPLTQAYESVAWGGGGLMAPNSRLLEFEATWRERIAQVDGLDHPEARTYEWVERYSTAQYIALLGTHSDHVTMEQESRTRLFGAVATVLDEAGGSIELSYSTQLCLARAIG